MTTTHTTLGTGSTPAAGMLAGAVLRTLRDHVGWSRDALAEHLAVSPDTVQSWETARRPLMNQSRGQLARHRRVLHAAGAPAHLVTLLDQALEADVILDGLAEPVATHPLALYVPNRAISDLLAWAITGTVPTALDGHQPQLHIAAGDRAEMVDQLRTVAETANGDQSGAMLARQALFLTGADMGAPTARSDGWSPGWALSRSAAVSAAIQGDDTPLCRFVDTGLASDQGQLANLTYWAYWVGETPATWTADADMTTDTHPWSGERLLGNLTSRLTTAPYRELHAHTIWALLKHKPHLAHSHLATPLGQAIDTARTDDRFSPTAHRRLDQVAYRIGSE